MISQKRGKNLAIAGVTAQLIFAAVMLVIWLWAHSLSAMAALVMLLGGLPVWLMVAMLFYVRQLERRETREVEELAATGALRGTIFEAEDGQQLRPAADRAAFVIRWIVPIFTLAWAVILAALAWVLFSYLRTRMPSPVTNFAPAIMVSLVVAFAGFLLSRYATGMSKGAEWRPLRPAGSYLLINVLAIVAVVASLVAASQDRFTVDLYAGYVIAAVMGVLVVELLLNFVLDLYRPRVPGQEQRLSFDSRLLGLIAEPGRVGHSIAETLNYQFGFEVSRTWFYQLLAKAALPLVILAVAVLLALSSVVLVREGEQHVILHWGRVERVVGSGLHFKWPWPIDKADRFNVGAVHEIMLGVGEEQEPEIIKGRELLLWTEEHGRRKELDFLIAVTPEAREMTLSAGEKPPPPVSIIKLVAAVQYVVEDVVKYGYEAGDARQWLEDVAYREMVQYCATATLDTPIPGDVANRPEAIMSYGREQAARELQKRIQAAADELDVGVRITLVGIVSAHPPAAAAEAFEAVFEAERRMDQTRHEAQAEADHILAEVAGEPDLGLELAAAIRTLERLRDLEQLRGDAEEIRRSVGAAIRAVRDSLAALDYEIYREQLLGLAREGRTTAKQRLRDRYRQYLQTLESIVEAPGQFDYTEALAEYDRQVAELFGRTAGRAAVLLVRAQADRWHRELSERGRWEAFRRELLAYQASPQVYTFDRWMDAWDQVLPGATKYVLGVDSDRVELRMNWERQRSAMEGAFDRPQEDQ